MTKIQRTLTHVFEEFELQLFKARARGIDPMITLTALAMLMRTHINMTSISINEAYRALDGSAEQLAALGLRHRP